MTQPFSFYLSPFVLHLEHILTPEARVFEYIHIPLWDTSEIILFKPPFSFNFLIEKYDFLREHRRMLDNHSKKEVIKDKKEETRNNKEWLEKYVEITKEDGTTRYTCKKCKYNSIHKSDIIDHLKACFNVLLKEEKDGDFSLQLRDLRQVFMGDDDEN